MNPVKLQDLVLVACHAPFKGTVIDAAADPMCDASWALQSFQKGEPRFYLEHIQRGVTLIGENSEALLLFSGGRTRLEAGQWSEGHSYLEIANRHRFWVPKGDRRLEAIKRRTDIEGFARDSFENLLFGVCRFQQIVGAYPRHVTVVGWGFKSQRFDLHREALAFPPSRFTYLGVNDPLDLDSAEAGERAVRRLFSKFPYGTGGELAAKRAARDPFSQIHDYAQCPGLRSFFASINDEAKADSTFEGELPWQTVREY